MIFFTILGLLVFWWICFGAGYTLGMWLDIRSGWLLSSMYEIDKEAREIEVMIEYLTVRNPAKNGGEG